MPGSVLPPGVHVDEHVVPTARGPAGLSLLRPEGDVRVVVALGHGAGGGVDAPDLAAAATALAAAGVTVGLVTQPHRRAGRRAPAPAAALDEDWLETVAVLRRLVGPAALVCGGRSSGARVACRTAADAEAVGVVALAFPLQPPLRGAARGRTGAVDVPAARPPRSHELVGAARAVPVLVVQGTADPFGGPADVVAAVRAAGLASSDRPQWGPSVVSVHEVVGADHSLRTGRPRRVPGDVPRVVVAAALAWSSPPGTGPASPPGIGPAGPGVGGSAQGPHPED